MVEAKPNTQDDMEIEAQESQTEGLEEAEPLSAIEQELVTLQAERDEMRDRMIRALADAENSRKRAEKDRRDAQLYGGARALDLHG